MLCSYNKTNWKKENAIKENHKEKTHLHTVFTKKIFFWL